MLYAGGFTPGVGAGVWVSKNAGSTWSFQSVGITNTNVKAVVVGADGFIYAGTGNGTSGGIFRSPPVCP